ncbi:unnamed protein product [Cylindrotheca closterium]|uniref:Uncharacterized protein n=1 Tax=Cylindrotheca closterium TaxID=2856 RepID=A0AAD2G548_9STRA|nr:unnamed protein product [Cylindrotheca closterium]
MTMSSPTMMVTPSSVDVPVNIPAVTKRTGPQHEISERSAFAGTITTDAESLSLSSVGSESEMHHMDRLGEGPEGAEATEAIQASTSELEVPDTACPSSSGGSSSPPTLPTSPTLPLSLPCSILKCRNSDRASIKDTKRAWKCLPKPDLDIIIGNASSSTTESSNTANTASTALNDDSPRKGLEWGVVQIRNYAQTIGDNPSVSYGTPIQLDWDYEENDAVQLLEYETNRGTRRTLRQMVLSYYHRKNVLSWQYGHTEADIKAAKKEASRTKFKREITCGLLMAMPVEAAVESARRKTKRYFHKKENKQG